LLKIGYKAPEFKLPDADENIISLNDLLGKKIILWFFPRASTPG
jgi:peroxiredoxin Q/BCP